jgi:hypothetical protein
VVLTVPKALPLFFYHDRLLLAELMQCGVQMLQDALAWVKREVLEAGVVTLLGNPVILSTGQLEQQSTGRYQSVRPRS